MTTKMKGLLKGLRYISQIFDSNCEEQEMQIGYPTDVKHVAHIGWDGPSVNPPTWMNEFRSAPLSTVGAEAMAECSPTRFASQDLNRNQGGGSLDSPPRDLPELPEPKPRRYSSSGAAGVDVPAQDSPVRDSPSRAPRHSRRNKSATEVSPLDSPIHEASTGSRHSGRRRNDNNSGLGGGTESPVKNLPLIPKIARRKKSKGSSAAAGGEGGGSSRSSRSKAPAESASPLDGPASTSDARASLPDAGSEEKTTKNLPAIKPSGEDERT